MLNVTQGSGARLHQFHPDSANVLLMEPWDKLLLCVLRCSLYSGMLVTPSHQVAAGLLN